MDAVYGELFAEEKATALVAEGATVYLGDHPGDMVAAHAANAYAVGVTTGANGKAALVAAGAAVTLSDLQAFAPWLTSRLGGAHTDGA